MATNSSYWNILKYECKENNLESVQTHNQTLKLNNKITFQGDPRPGKNELFVKIILINSWGHRFGSKNHNVDIIIYANLVRTGTQEFKVIELSDPLFEEESLNDAQILEAIPLSASLPNEIPNIEQVRNLIKNYGSDVGTLAKIYKYDDFILEPNTWYELDYPDSTALIHSVEVYDSFSGIRYSTEYRLIDSDKKIKIISSANSDLPVKVVIIIHYQKV